MTSDNNIKNKIELLRKKIENWNKEYYINDNPSVDDSIYDQAINELIELEKKYPQFDSDDSPTKKVGHHLEKASFKKEEHNILPMLSLKNAFNEADLLHFDNQLKKLLNIDKNLAYFVEPKIDGLSISLTYKNGELIRALTRGDGKIGENVTENVKQIKSIPKKISLKQEVEIRGEVYISLKSFEELNNKRILYNKNHKKQKDLFANPRNAAAGTLRQLDPYVVKNRNLDAFFFSLLFLKDEKKINSQKLIIEKLNKLGFKVNNLSRYASNINEVLEIIEDFIKIRNELNYEIDGIVIKLDNQDYYDKLGATTKFPRSSIAYKFPAEVKETKLLDIFPTVGRTGRITYNAKLEKINLLGTTVQKATLHNANYIHGLNINIGDYVLVKKAGDIIPKVIGLSQERKKVNLKKWKAATRCPSCNNELKIFEGEVDQYCININCPSKIIESLIHFSSKKGMNIEGLSIKQIEKFYNLGFLKKVTDIYKLEKYRDKILQLEGYKEKSVNNLLTSIENSKEQNLNNLIFAMGIRYIGEKTSLDLAKKYKSIEKIKQIKYDDLINDENFGITKANSIVTFFKNSENLKLIDEFKELNVNLKYKNILLDKKNFFYNKKVLITGKIEGISRSELKEILISYGADIKNSLTKDLDYLIVGEKGSVQKIKNIDQNKIIKIKNINEFLNKYG